MVSAADLAHTVSAVFGAPLLDLNAIDPCGFPRTCWTPRFVQSYRVLVLEQAQQPPDCRDCRPTDQEAAEKIKFTTQMGVDWVIAEYDKLSKLVDANTKSVGESLDTFNSSGDFEFDDVSVEESTEAADTGAADVEDAPIVKFLHKMLLDAFNMRASDLHFEPYEHHYRVRFRIDGELREIASPPIAIKDKLASRIKVISRLDISENGYRRMAA